MWEEKRRGERGEKEREEDERGRRNREDDERRRRMGVMKKGGKEEQRRGRKEVENGSDEGWKEEQRG